MRLLYDSRHPAQVPVPDERFDAPTRLLADPIRQVSTPRLKFWRVIIDGMKPGRPDRPKSAVSDFMQQSRVEECRRMTPENRLLACVQLAQLGAELRRAGKHY